MLSLVGTTAGEVDLGTGLIQSLSRNETSTAIGSCDKDDLSSVQSEFGTYLARLIADITHGPTGTDPEYELGAHGVETVQVEEEVLCETHDDRISRCVRTGACTLYHAGARTRTEAMEWNVK